ncbi:MAG: hypothetical protein BWX92_01856 [Deltaproteobacteria bacterium ADurb.Bin135]|nr:MAG: hypothetical protein BWX92_01856 [Deltaproteobacteria bacterium ADurb.Bin135]
MEGVFYSESMRMAISEFPHLLGDEDSLKESTNPYEDYLELDELKTYFVRFYGEHVPEFVSHLQATNKSSCFVRKFPDKVFEISFNNYSGMTRFGPVNVKVKNKKIPEELYNSMLNYIALKYANLVFSFNTPLGQSYGREKPGSDIAYIEYLFLKTFLLEGSPNIDGIAALILNDPHIRINIEYSITPMEKVSFVEPGSLLKTLLKSDSFAVLPPHNPLSRTRLAKTLALRTGNNLFPAKVVAQYKYHTVDTSENRFVKHFLKQIRHRLDGLASSMRGISGTYLNSEIKANIEKILKKIDMFLKDPLWADVAPMTFIPANSQVLQRREGYRQLFSLYSLLQLCTRCDFDAEDFKNLLETKDTPTLFEYWSFFLIKDILDGMLKNVSSKTIVSEDQKEQKVYQGINIKYEGEVNLWFNKNCRGSSGSKPGEDLSLYENIRESYSHNLIPDIVVSKGEKMLILDAKYKGKQRTGTFYGEDEPGGIYKWKEEDIDKMHTYREAIKNVVGAFILYPGEEAVMYPAHNAKRLYEGVGALPLKPADGAMPVERHIDNIKKIIDDFLKEG